MNLDHERQLSRKAADGFWPLQVVCIPENSARQKFESPPLPTRMNAGFPQKLLTFSEKYGN
jgi:hypothetical protein